MRAIWLEKHGGLDRLRLVERPCPEAGPGQVLVRVKALALNHLDLFVRRGVPGHRFPLPLVPGSDAAGVVEATGPGVSGLLPGQEVVCFPGVSCGFCEACLSGRDPLCPDYGILGESRDGVAAELVALPRANVHEKPDSLSMVRAAAFPLTFQTAWNLCIRRARLEPGETVLVQAGGSGVGTAAIQIARLLGARVLATAGSEKKRRGCLELGAEAVLDYRREDLAPWIKDLTGGRGVDVVVDHLGAETFRDSVKALARGGRLVTCGATTGSEVEVHLAQLFFKSQSWLGSTMGNKGDLLKILRLVSEGSLAPVVGERLEGLESYPEAQALLEERKVFGKVVVSLE